MPNSSPMKHCGARTPASRVHTRLNAWLLTIAGCIVLTNCSKPKEEEPEPVIPVQVSEVKQDSIDRIVTASAILYPVDQAAAMPKISAPVKIFHVKRGDHVAKDQLLAVLD